MKLLRPTLLLAISLFTWRSSAFAQLRPLDPVDYHAFTGEAVRFELGGSMLSDQRASLAGTTGRLWEVGNFRLQIRTGRIVLDFGGTLQRLFHETGEVFAAPYGDAAPSSATHNRHDSGDYRASTVVRLSGDDAATLTTLRFGTRLPTTDNMTGLDRDATDFFSTLGAQHHWGRFSIAADAGLSINGTRSTTHEQSDVFTYGATAEWERTGVTPYIATAGQDDMHKHAFRGTEDLGELRIGARTTGRRWLNIAWVHGYRTFSPSNGVLFSGGLSFR